MAKQTTPAKTNNTAKPAAPQTAAPTTDKKKANAPNATARGTGGPVVIGS